MGADRHMWIIKEESISVSVVCFSWKLKLFHDSVRYSEIIIRLVNDEELLYSDSLSHYVISPNDNILFVNIVKYSARHMYANIKQHNV